MSSSAIIYYISGHGYGHARRSAEVIADLAGRRPDLHIHIATTAAPAIFEDLPHDRVHLRSEGLDPGAVEDSVLSINRHRTAEEVRKVLHNRRSLIDRELRFIRDNRIGFVVADIPFLAGDVAEAAGLPSLAVGNFTWDWIYEPWFANDPADSSLIAEVQRSYAKLPTILKLPFGGRTDMFREVICVPLIVNRSHLEPAQVRSILGLNGSDDRPVVLIGQRGGLPLQTLERGVRGAPGFHFIYLDHLAAPIAENLTAIRLGPELRFADVLRVSDAVVSKLGYGTVADCIGADVAMLWPRREGFREDGVMGNEAASAMRMREIPVPEFEQGEWNDHLQTLLAQPHPTQPMPTNGAETCARIIAERIGITR